jgi:hypothetical protein
LEGLQIITRSSWRDYKLLQEVLGGITNYYKKFLEGLQIITGSSEEN